MASTAIRRETAPWVEPVGRIGLASQGVLYAIVGVLALQVASGHEEDRADQHGALYAVVEQPFGRFLLFALMIGLAFHALWRLLLFLRGSPGDDDADDYAKRLGHLGRAVVYATFTWGAIEVLFDADDGRDRQRGVLATVLDWPLGQVLVGAVGLVIAGTGIWHMSKAFTRPFVDDLDLDGRNEGVRTAVMALGAIGWFARGVAFVVVGWFVVQAAADQDPSETGGLDGALKHVVQSDHGPGILRVLALGVFMFGLYRLADAALRKRDAISNA